MSNQLQDSSRGLLGALANWRQLKTTYRGRPKPPHLIVCDNAVQQFSIQVKLADKQYPCSHAWRCSTNRVYYCGPLHESPGAYARRLDGSADAQLRGFGYLDIGDTLPAPRREARAQAHSPDDPVNQILGPPRCCLITSQSLAPSLGVQGVPC